MTHSWEQLYSTEEKHGLDEFGQLAYSTYRRWIGPRDKRILDAGFGSGRFCLALARDLPASRITGIDISADLVEQARQAAKAGRLTKNLNFRQADIFRLPFGDGTFDVVFNEGVIEHLENYEQAVAEMVRVTKPGGKVIVGVPNWLCLPHTLIKRLLGGKYQYGFELSFTQRQLKALFRQAGLTDLESAGYYPMWSLKRYKSAGLFAGSVKTLPLRLAARAAGPIEHVLVRPLDLITGKAVSRQFGFEIVIKGRKPIPGEVRPRLAVIGQETTPVPRVKGGSVALVTDEMVKRLKDGYDLRIFSITDPLCPATEIIDGVKYVRFSTWFDRKVIRRVYNIRQRLSGQSRHLFYNTGYYFIWHALRTGLAARRFKPDLIHVHNVPLHASVLKEMCPRAKVVLHMHCQWLTEMPAERTSRHLESVDLICGVGAATAQAVRERFPLFADKCVTLPNGVDYDMFARVAPPAVKEAKKRFGVKARDRVLLYVGRITPEKGIHTLLLAMPAVLKSAPGAKLLIVGPDWLSPRHPVAKPYLGNVDELKPNYTVWLEMIASALGDRVVFAGEIPTSELPAIYAAADLFVFPSFEETSPLPILEAMAAGTPVVAGAIGGVIDLVSDKQTGWLCPHNDPKALAAVIRNVLEMPKAKRSKVARAAQKRVQTDFTWDRFAQTWDTFYRRLLTAQPDNAPAGVGLKEASESVVDEV